MIVVLEKKNSFGAYEDAFHEGDIVGGMGEININSWKPVAISNQSIGLKKRRGNAFSSAHSNPLHVPFVVSDKMYFKMKIACATSASLALFCTGLVRGWSSSAVPQLTSYKNESSSIRLEQEEAAWISEQFTKVTLNLN